ncbi:MAG: sugar ABC transporter substrate-binding protein [Christensenella sp.]
MKKVIAIVLVMVLAFSLMACTGTTQPKESAAEAAVTEEAKAEKPEEAKADAGEKIKIGLSLPSLISQYFEANKKASTDAAAAAGAELVVVNADGDAATQKKQIQDLISGGCQAVIAVSQDSDAIVSSAADCAAANVAFIALGRKPTDMKDVSLYLGFSNEQSAGLCAENIKKAATALGQDKVKIIEMVGDLNDTNAVERKDFFEKKAKELGMEIVAEVPTEWDVDTAFNRLTDTIQNTEEYNAIYAPSDILIPAIMSVLSARGEWVKYGEDNYKIITAIDGSPTGVAAVKEGYVYCTSNDDAFVLGKAGVESAIDIIKNGAPTEKEQTLESMPVTKDVADKAGDSIWGNAFAD